MFFFKDDLTGGELKYFASDNTPFGVSVNGTFILLECLGEWGGVDGDFGCGVDGDFGCGVDGDFGGGVDGDFGEWGCGVDGEDWVDCCIWFFFSFAIFFYFKKTLSL